MPSLAGKGVATVCSYMQSYGEQTKPLGTQASIFCAGRVVLERVSGVKWWGWQRWGHQLVLMGWQSIRIVGVSACVIFVLHQKIQKTAKCTFWYQLTRVVPDKVQRTVKWLCVCVLWRRNLRDSIAKNQLPQN